MLKGGQALERLKPLGGVVSIDEGGEVLALHCMRLAVVVAPDCRLLECSVHTFNLAVGPQVIAIGQAISKEAQPHKTSPRSMACLIRLAAEATLPGVVKCVPLSVSTVWMV